MLRALMAVLLSLAPVLVGPTDGGAGDADRGNDEWRCDGSPADHCNPSP